ncbi:hypothetical protein BHM03_00050725 [Ensete ventricosum]|uniref:Uncharacterized protein n=1 Tax=Ensete ventricosum TaxID=4639 RepID=A0A445MLR9_ENSVE|nr:hypothetical protein BHM03_00050725 [Ensete ventricosum]
MAGSMKLQPDDGPRKGLGIRPSSNDAVRSRQKFARRFVEGIGKLIGNAMGDYQEEDRGTCRKIVRGYQSMREIRATASRCQRVNYLDGGWTARTTDYGWRPTVDGG